ncbi:MAG: FeoB-associated Cys-rich membrane protein [Eubacterium sp.]|nr:FeoB-associated Cys-rich membrane protein [Eubacterium sp.]
MANIIVVIILAVVVGLAVRHIVKSLKSGSYCGCSGNCSSCSGCPGAGTFPSSGRKPEDCQKDLNIKKETTDL